MSRGDWHKRERTTGSILTKALNWRPGAVVMVILLAVRQSHSHLLDGRLHLMSRRTIVGGDGERFALTRRGRWQTVCSRGADRALPGGPSTSPLGFTRASRRHFALRPAPGQRCVVYSLCRSCSG